jgi:hypothetical protein
VISWVSMCWNRGAKEEVPSVVDFWFEPVGVCFITAGPITKLFAWGGEDSGGHVLRETTSLGPVRNPVL